MAQEKVAGAIVHGRRLQSLHLADVSMAERKLIEAKLIEHLEAAQAITDELGLDHTGYLVERALDDARAVHWPHIDPNVEAFRKPPHR